MLSQVKSVTSFPSAIQYFKPEHVEPFKELDKIGEFTVEFMPVAIQERTNYPTATLTESLYKSFGVKDRFQVIQKAIWRG